MTEERSHKSCYQLQLHSSCFDSLKTGKERVQAVPPVKTLQGSGLIAFKPRGIQVSHKTQARSVVRLQWGWVHKCVVEGPLPQAGWEAIRKLPFHWLLLRKSGYSERMVTLTDSAVQLGPI